MWNLCLLVSFFLMACRYFLCDKYLQIYSLYFSSDTLKRKSDIFMMDLAVTVSQVMPMRRSQICLSPGLIQFRVELWSCGLSTDTQLFHSFIMNQASLPQTSLKKKCIKMSHGVCLIKWSAQMYTFTICTVMYVLHKEIVALSPLVVSIEILRLYQVSSLSETFSEVAYHCMWKFVNFLLVKCWNG